MFLMISLYVLDVSSVPLPHADLKPEPPRYFNCHRFLSSSPCQPRVPTFFFFLHFIPSLSLLLFLYDARRTLTAGAVCTVHAQTEASHRAAGWQADLVTHFPGSTEQRG